MRKKILCAIMSAVMIVGALTGCGSSSGDTSKETEESIMTQIIPGESTADELESYLQNKGIVWENNTKGQPQNCTNTDYFLGHEAQFSDFDYANGKVYAYRVEVAFKNVDDYKTGLNETKEYFKKRGTGITGYNDDDGGDKEPIKCYLLEDETDYYTAVLPWVSTYDEVEGDYYNSILKFVYYRVDKHNKAEETVLWKDEDGNSYTTKFDKASGKSVNYRESTESTETTESIKKEDSTESTYREDSTEASQQENSNLTAEKQTYDVEEEVNKIRDIYYWVQGDSSNLTKQDGGSVTRWIDSNGKIRKIVAPAGTYDDTNGADAAKYNAEFYYNENEELVFVFLYSGKEEHRLYVVQGKCVRYIDQDRSVNDYPELKEADSVCGLGYFIGLGMMEIHYAYV